MTNNLALTAGELVLFKVVLWVYYISVDPTGLGYKNCLYKVDCRSGTYLETQPLGLCRYLTHNDCLCQTIDTLLWNSSNAVLYGLSAAFCLCTLAIIY